MKPNLLNPCHNNNLYSHISNCQKQNLCEPKISPRRKSLWSALNPIRSQYYYSLGNRVITRGLWPLWSQDRRIFQVSVPIICLIRPIRPIEAICFEKCVPPIGEDGGGNRPEQFIVPLYLFNHDVCLIFYGLFTHSLTLKRLDRFRWTLICTVSHWTSGITHIPMFLRSRDVDTQVKY